MIILLHFSLKFKILKLFDLLDMKILCFVFLAYKEFTINFIKSLPTVISRKCAFLYMVLNYSRKCIIL